MAKLRVAAPLILAALVAVAYYASFKGLPAVISKRNAVAFADSSHYIELLTDRHYVECARTEVGYHIEHRRKTVHHAGYILFGDAVVSIGKALLPGARQIDVIWAVSPLLGGINFVLAFLLFRRVAPGLEMPAALAYALTPATWIYAAIPETWTFVGGAVLAALLLRELRVSPLIAVPIIAVLALANFLVLLLVLLFQDEQQPLVTRVLRVAGLGVAAALIWVGLLSLLGVALTPDFLPHRFYEQTAAFKARMGENLSIVNPFRWAYTFVNGMILPFVLNQHDLNFGRRALLDSVLAFPFGTAAVAVLGVIGVRVLRYSWSVVRGAVRAGAWASLATGPAMYLAAAFVATGLALYYESFLYSPLFLPVLLVLMLRAVAGTTYAKPLMWTAATIWAFSSAQQILYFRGALGG